MNKYSNRYEAGKILAEPLKEYSYQSDVIVLALPRGGVPVAFEIAQALSIPLDLFIVRKIGVPGHEELAMGAIATGGVIIFNHDIVKNLRISEEDIKDVIENEKKELNRREIAYRGAKPYPDLKNKTVILVDDGIATGASMRAAIKAIRQFAPAKIVVAVPVAEKTTCEKMADLVDKVICPLQSDDFFAVGQWYDDFSQTTDEEVRELLLKAMG